MTCQIAPSTSVNGEERLEQPFHQHVKLVGHIFTRSWKDARYKVSQKLSGEM